LYQWENSVDSIYFESRGKYYSVFHWDVSCGKDSHKPLIKYLEYIVLLQVNL